MTDETTILLVDDHMLVIESLAHRLSGEPDFTVLAAATSVDEAAAVVERLNGSRLDIVLVDVELNGRDSFELVGRIRRDRPGARVVFLTAHLQPAYVARAAALEAEGYICKSEPTSTLIDALRRIRDGQRYYSPAAANQVFDGRSADAGAAAGGLASAGSEAEVGGSGSRPMADSQVLDTDRSTLSPRLREVLDYLLSGESEKRIAFQLKISPHTVHNHIRRIYHEFNVSSRSELMARFIRRPGRAE